MLKTFSFILITTLLFSSEINSQNLYLDITGETSDETKLLNSFPFETKHEDYNSVINEVNMLQKTLYKKGYIESRYESVKKTNDSTFTALFQLNNKYETIHINYTSDSIEKKTIELITKEHTDTGFIIPFKDIEQTLQFINSKISNKGFPFTKLKLSNISTKDNKTLEANLSLIKPDKKRSLDKIVIKGYSKFSKSYLKHYLKIKPEKTFNLETIKEKTNQLSNLSFASQLRAPEILFTKDSTELYLYIEKKPSNTFDGFLGFGTNEATQKIDFNGYLNLNLINNLNYGETFKLLYKSDENDQKNFEAKLNLPYLFNSPIGTALELSIFKKDSSFTTINQIAKLYYQLSPKSKLFAGIDNIESNNLLDQNSTLQLDDYKSNFYTIAYHYENRKNYNRLFQVNSLLTIELGLGNKQTKEAREKQNRITTTAHHIFNLNPKNSIFIKLTGALLDSENYLENELMRFGGINSIRGFQENSLLASQFGVINTEYRYKLSNSVYAHTIIDFANLQNKITKQTENLYGFGIGFGLLTKAGLFRFNYANGRLNNQEFKLSNSKIHLSLTTLF